VPRFWRECRQSLQSVASQIIERLAGVQADAKNPMTNLDRP